MPYKDSCPDCYGRGFVWRRRNIKSKPQKVTCTLCGGSCKVKPYRVQLTMLKARKYGWTTFHSWPRFGPPRTCQCCGIKLTGRRRTICGRTCAIKLYGRLYKNVHWAKRHVAVRDGCACKACGILFESPIVAGGPIIPDASKLELDHVKPMFKCTSPQEAESENNLQLLCPDCHTEKSIRERGNLPVKFVPKRKNLPTMSLPAEDIPFDPPATLPGKPPQSPPDASENQK